MSPTARGLLLVIISAFGYSTEAILTKAAYGLGLSTPTTLFYRFSLAAVLLLPILTRELRRNRLPLKTHLRLIAIAVGLNAPVVASLTYSLNFISASVAIIVLYLYPAIVAVLGTRLLSEPLTRVKVLSLFLSFGGVAFVALPGEHSVSLTGLLWAFLAALLNAVSVIALKKHLSRAPSVFLASEVIVLMSLVFTAASLLEGGPQPLSSPAPWMAVLGLALVSTVLPFATFYGGLKYLAASTVSIVSSSEPVMTIVLAYLFLGETLYPAQAAGALMVLGAVYLVSAESRRQPAR